MSEELSAILVSIDELAGRARISRSRAFAAWYAITFFDLDEDDALESAAADGGNDQGIDIVFPDDNTEEIVVIQAHCPENFAKHTPKEKWNSVISSLSFIKNPQQLANAGRPDLAETILDLKKAYPNYKYSVGLITLGLKSSAIEMSRRACDADNSYKDYSFFHYSQNEIEKKYKSLMDAEGGIPVDRIKFSGNHFEDSGDYGRAWVGSISASELKRLYDDHEDKLFAGNIRLFLGSRKGGINEQMIKTAKTNPGAFWALNNGITIVADSAEIDKQDNSLLNLQRFSVVNGCQTTSCLVRAAPKPSAKVLVRVISAKSALKNEIVRYNNSQNAIKIWTVRAADEIQESLRKAFGEANIKYAPKQAGSRKKKDEHIIELDKLTQYLASSDAEYLIQAIDNKSELFDEPYQKLFKKNISSTHVYLAWLVVSIADKKRKEFSEKIKDDLNAHLLGVTSVYWIVYCTYKLLYKFTDPTSGSFTLPRMKSREFQNSLAKYIDGAVSLFWDAAVDTYEREEYGSYKSTLRSPRFLKKIESKINGKIAKLPSKFLPDLKTAAKTAKAEFA